MRQVTVGATVHKAYWCARGDRCIEATNVASLSAQSPSERRRRLGFEANHTCGSELIDKVQTIRTGLMDSRPYRTAYHGFSDVVLNAHPQMCEDDKDEGRESDARKRDSYREIARWF